MSGKQNLLIHKKKLKLFNSQTPKFLIMKKSKEKDLKIKIWTLPMLTTFINDII